MLQSSIRVYASSYLADNMFTLPGLPTQDKYDAMLKEKEIKRDRVKKEKQSAAAAFKNNSLKRGALPTPRTPSPAPLHEARHVQAAHSELDGGSEEIPHSHSHTHNLRSGQAHTTVERRENNNTGFLRSGTNMFRSWKNDLSKHAVFQAVSVSKSVESSWGPTQVSYDRDDETTDPILQQIRNLKSYIRQAREDGRLDEVEMFERNLQELQDAFSEQRTREVSVEADAINIR